MKVLMIYENVPETTDAYLIDTTDEMQIQDLRLAHGNYLNAAENDEIDSALQRINFYLCDTVTDAFAEWVGLPKYIGGDWVKFKLPTTQPIDIKDMNVDLLVITGFIM